MKKLLALLLLLCVLSLGALTAVGLRLDADKDSVTVTERSLYGDRSLAKGLGVDLRAHYDDHLYWTVRHTLGEEDSTHTEFDFSLRELHEKAEHAYEGISLYNTFFYDWDLSTPIEQLSGLPRAFRELYDVTPVGKEVKKTVYVKDYYDYYPIGIRIDLPRTVWTGDPPLANVEGLQAGDEMYEYYNFQNFFRIPVDETETVEILVDRDNSNGISTMASQSYYPMRSESTYTEDGICYFSIYNKKDDGTIIDASLIPGGYGLYSFRFGRGEERNDSGVYADSLSMVYPLEETVEVCHMTTNDEETRLLLFTAEADELRYLNVIDLATMETVQRLCLGELPFYHVWEYGDYLVLGIYDHIALVALAEDGSYELRFAAPTPEQMDPSFHYIDTSAVMAYDGERLAVVGRLHEKEYGALELCGFYLALYGKDGLLYYGEYESSLSRNPRANQYNFNCLPSGAYPFRIGWR